MVFDDFPDDTDPDQLEQIAVKRFRALRGEVYKLMPADCLLRPDNVLTSTMVEVLDADLIRAGLIEEKDICSVCSERGCPHNEVKDRQDRISKINFLNETRYLKPQ